MNKMSIKGKVKKITEIGQYTHPDEQEKFPEFIKYLKNNAKHEVGIDPRFEKPERTWQPDAGFEQGGQVENPWQPDGPVPFQERMIRNLNLKPKKKLSKYAQSKLEWYNRRRKK